MVGWTRENRWGYGACLQLSQPETVVCWLAAGKVTTVAVKKSGGTGVGEECGCVCRGGAPARMVGISSAMEAAKIVE
ncbi:uncharacterized protein M6B38_353600 [Iris pallida]|uniref:Uncharacterized protein n=1 Tax=Iris pallida TaxID=29817 RepID=A0AAX6GP49_IRIPA|nr:uncharacterized protein M6B38_353600 [Iris pallida]